jgi:Short C-terminal domain
MILIVLAPTLCFAQKTVPYLEGDTLYTSSGFKIYKGQTLQLTEGTGRGGYFRFIRNAWDTQPIHLTNSAITIIKMEKFAKTPLNNSYVWVKVRVIYHDGTTGKGGLKINFDKAIQSFRGMPSEIIVPDEFKIKEKTGTTDEELKKLQDLLDSGTITREEYDAEKKKLLKQ